jgi:hypothetical protein
MSLRARMSGGASTLYPAIPALAPTLASETGTGMPVANRFPVVCMLAFTALATAGCSGASPTNSATPLSAASTAPRSIPVPSCGSESLGQGDMPVQYSVQKLLHGTAKPVVQIVTRANVKVLHDCVIPAWDVSITADGSPAVKTTHLAGGVSSGPLPAGEVLILTFRWAGPFDLTKATQGAFTINGAEIPLTLRGWTKGAVTWSGPEKLSALPHSSIPPFRTSTTA